MLSASEAANFFSGRTCVANDADFTGVSSHKTTTMRRTIRLQIRSVRALSARFLGAMIVEWLFPMLIDKMPTCLHRMPSPPLRQTNKLFA
jgi:hypothetical protein